MVAICDPGRFTHNNIIVAVIAKRPEPRGEILAVLATQRRN
jgi:hypothetical protein